MINNWGLKVTTNGSRVRIETVAAEDLEVVVTTTDLEPDEVLQLISVLMTKLRQIDPKSPAIYYHPEDHTKEST